MDVSILFWTCDQFCLTQMFHLFFFAVYQMKVTHIRLCVILFHFKCFMAKWEYSGFFFLCVCGKFQSIIYHLQPPTPIADPPHLFIMAKDTHHYNHYTMFIQIHSTASCAREPWSCVKAFGFDWSTENKCPITHTHTQIGMENSIIFSVSFNGHKFYVNMLHARVCLHRILYCDLCSRAHTHTFHGCIQQYSLF